MKAVPVQRLGPTEAIFTLTPPLPRNSGRRFRLSAATEPESGDKEVRSYVNRGAAVFRVRNQPALAFNVDEVEPPDGLGREFRRSGHIHPVWTPAGRAVTDDFVPGDEHKHGIYSAWVNAVFQGRTIDFWNQWKLTGTVENRRVLAQEDGSVFGSLTAEMAYVDLSVKGERKDVLYEEWTVRVYRVTEGRLFEIESRQRCATADPVILRQHNYGGMAVRGPYAWQKQRQTDFLTSEGKNRIEGNNTRPNWVNMHGTIDNQPCGLTMFCHPSNFRAPQAVRIHPQLIYFVFTPVKLGEFTIKPGDTYVARFRFFAQDGAPDASRLEAIWNDYATPPTVAWEE